MAEDFRVWNSAQSSFGSDLSNTSTIADNSAQPASPVRQRPGYARLGSDSNAEEPESSRKYGQPGASRLGPAFAERGLGVVPEDSLYATAGASRSPPTGQSTPGIVFTPGSENPAFTPPLLPTPAFPKETAYDPLSYDTSRNLSANRYSRSGADDYVGFMASAENEALTQKASPSLRSARTGMSKYDETFQPAHNCPSHTGFYMKATHWLTVVVYVLAIFSTVFSGIYLGIALRAPRWGRKVHTGGSFSPSTANVLTNLFAKLIELSFVAVFVTFLGQVLSRRAISKTGAGMTLAEMNMRHWIMQPGTMITHYETVQFAALTVLGAASLSVTIVAMFYTTAASALVAPQLKFGKWETRTLTGNVLTTFANAQYMAATCSTPIRTSPWNPNLSPSLVGSTCLQIDHAANGFHNYHRYMTFWADLEASGNGTVVQTDRPMGFGLFQENTTINASWIHTIDTKDVSNRFNRIVNNVTLAYPHSNVFSAARDPRSDIMQPEDLGGVGAYSIKAAVPSPYINVLCANMNKTELQPFIYGGGNVTLNYTADLPTKFLDNVDFAKLYNTPTAVDDIFQWNRHAMKPVFYKYPLDFNTLLNNTGVWPQSAVYLLGKGDSLVSPDYFMCRLMAGLTPDCSTHYNAQGSGGSMAAHCNDPLDDFSYARGSGNSSRVETISEDWYWVATEGMNAMSLNNGVTDGAASNARMLTQLQLTDKTLSAKLPSPAEALAVMNGCTLLMAGQDAPFVEYWNYSDVTIAATPQTFNAAVRAQQFASGGTQPYQKLFYIILFIVFVTNLLVLAYFFWQRGLVTDFSEPPNLFSIAVNSPPNELLAGSCGGGPFGHHYKVNWKVEHENDHLFIDGRMPLASRGFATGRDDASGKGGFTALRHKSGPGEGADEDDPEEIEMGDRRGRPVTARSSLGGASLTPSTTMGLTPQSTAEGGPFGERTPPRTNKVSRMYSKLSKRKSFI